MIRPVTKREDGWLLFDAPLPKGVPMLRDIEVAASLLLGLNATLPAGCKFALVGAADLRVRAELPELADRDAPARGAAVEAGFVTAIQELRAGSTSKPSNREASNDASAPELANLCREAGWAFEERPDGTLVVDLGVPGAYVPALVEARTSGFAVEAILIDALPASRARRVAIASLLLRANGAFRMARAVFRSVEAGSQAMLEASLPSDADAVEFGLALGAVAVAAQHCAVEARMLAEDDRLALAYTSRFPTEERPAPASETEISAQVWA